MKVLLTGANSLIGAGVADRLLADGHAVVAYDIERSRVPTGCEFVAGDVRDLSALADAAAGCDAGLHLAARAGEHPPEEIIAVNVIGAIAFLRAARSAGFTSTVVASSAPVHLQPGQADRNILLRTGDDSDHTYDLSKTLQEVVARDFHGHGLACLCVRFGHVVDGGRGVTLGDGSSLAGEGYCRGGWVAIEDVISACVAALMVVPDADRFEVLTVVGSLPGRKRFDVAGTEERLGLRLRFDFAEFDPVPE